MSDLTRVEVIENLEDLSRRYENAIHDYYGIARIEVHKDECEAVKIGIDSLKTDEAYQIEYEKRDFIEIPEGATNGQMFCRLFQPYGLKENGSCVWVWFTESDGTHYTLPKDWFNSPYRKEQE